jgi:hypothetical protein
MPYEGGAAGVGAEPYCIAVVVAGGVIAGVVVLFDSRIAQASCASSDAPSAEAGEYVGGGAGAEYVYGGGAKLVVVVVVAGGGGLWARGGGFAKGTCAGGGAAGE